MKLRFIVIFVFLLPLLSTAQDCTATVYLDSQTIKAGDVVTIGGAVINGQPGKQFVVAQDGRATLQASRRIELNSGFKALTGSRLNAGIQPCDPDGNEPEPSVVFPNPTDGVINIKASYKMGAVRVTDMSGFVAVIKTDINDVALTLDLSSLKPGFYIVEIIVGKDIIEAIRIEKK
jgi:hypothetical protein